MADRPEVSDEALIAFVRGALPPAEAATIASEAAQSPLIAAEVALMRGIAAAVAEEAREPAPGALGWARLSRALDAERSPRRPIWRPIWPLAASAAAAVLLWQVVAVPILPRPDPDASYAPVSEAPADGFAVAVAFAPAATEAAIRALLREIDARVTDGPSAIGLWRLSFDSGAAREAGLARLRSAGIVESAQPQ